jgi:hypothetical protein
MSHYSARAQWNTANARAANEPFDYLFGECECEKPDLNKKGWCNICNHKRRPAQAVTTSGLYNCEVCGEEKCKTPGICADCAAPPTEQEIMAWVVTTCTGCGRDYENGGYISHAPGCPYAEKL